MSLSSQVEDSEQGMANGWIHLSLSNNEEITLWSPNVMEKTTTTKKTLALTFRMSLKMGEGQLVSMKQHVDQYKVLPFPDLVLVSSFSL